ncbi:unnamed protein product, partial [marine sediment metagenome]
MLNEWKQPEIEHLVPTKWNWIVSYPENLKLGRHVDIGCFTYIQAQAGIIIEDDVQIGSHCSIYSVSTINEMKGRVVLKKGCRIGSHVIIMPGVVIGEGAVVGARAYIDKDVPAHSKLIP